VLIIIFSIEHLPAEVLECFCPMILGRYSPSILAITTPNYEFNKLFSPPDHESRSCPPEPGRVREGGHLDPTGRTNRVFRHHDHKFEWTREEFQTWCEENARTWGYDVVVSGVGRSQEPDPWGRDERGSSNTSVDNQDFIKGKIGLFATQTAVFTRVRKEKAEHQKEYAERAIHFLDDISSNLDISTTHELVADYIHLAHPSVSSDETPTAKDDILETVRRAMRNEINREETEILDLWNCDEVSIACQGNLEKLYDAFIHAEADVLSQSEPILDTHISEKEWSWVRPEECAVWARRIRWNKFVPIESHSLWEDEINEMKIDGFVDDEVEEQGIDSVTEPIDDGWTLQNESDGWASFDWKDKEIHGIGYDGWGAPTGVMSQG
jgi:small RNA 2'-O-methyltransferase